MTFASLASGQLLCPIDRPEPTLAGVLKYSVLSGEFDVCALQSFCNLPGCGSAIFVVFEETVKVAELPLTAIAEDGTAELIENERFLIIALIFPSRCLRVAARAAGVTTAGATTVLPRWTVLAVWFLPIDRLDLALA